MRRLRDRMGIAVDPVLRLVGENLYRLESTRGYYALLKTGSKQIRRSLKTGDVTPKG